MTDPWLDRFLTGRAPRSLAWTAPTPERVNGSRPQAWLTGTGSPVVHPDRSGPSVTIRTDDDVVLVDCGSGVTNRLAAIGVQISEISLVAITHLHIDHIAELPSIMLSPWATEHRKRPLRIIGPQGTREVVDRLLAAFHYDILVREPLGFDESAAVPEVWEIGAAQEFGGSQWSARSFEVEHKPVWPAFGYVFELGGARLVISGDTRPSQGVIDNARGCDVLVHEAIWPGWGFPDYHTTPRDAGRIAADAQVSHLVLTHLIPGHLSDAAWLNEVRLHFGGRCSVGADLMPLIR